MTRIAKESLLFFAGTLIPAAVSFISVPIFTRYFTPQEYGVNSLIDTSFSYISIILFGIISSIVWRYYNEYKNLNKSDEFLGLISFLIRGSAFVTILGILTVLFFSKLDNNIKKLIIAKGIAIILTAYTSIYNIVLRLDGKAKLFNAIQVFNSLANFLLIYLLTKLFGMRNIAMYVSTIIVNIFILTFLCWNFRSQSKKYLPFKETITALLPLVSYAIIALLSNFAQNVLDSSDRYMISYFEDINSVGLYDKLYAVSNKIIAIFSTVFMNLFSPYIYKSLSDKKTHIYFKEIMPVYVGIFFPLVLYYSVFSDTICKILLAKEYSDWYFILPCICLGYCFITLANFPELIIRFKNPKIIPFGYILGVVLNIVLNFLLIPKFSIMGAAIGTVVSYFFVLIFFTIIAKLKTLDYFFSYNIKVNLLFIIPIIECFIYQFVIKRILILSTLWCVLLAFFMASSYFLPFLYYYFIRNKKFTQLFEIRN